ncbi:MAG TPA: Uma2 family endonuclease [Tepidisphaeraceae bacterium]|jgi:Uma2 family endonuclease|nr:Uma2 family endonuclease [Tepidisphaeraceae bacterium]
MAGGSEPHSLISVNLIGELRNRLKGNPCAVYDPNMRLKVMATGLRTYPDASVYCGGREYDSEDMFRLTLTNPTFIFEVLSLSTEVYDRGMKASHYRRIESLKALVLGSQDMPRVEVYCRQGDGTWALRELEGLSEALKLPMIGVELPLSEIFDRVDFSTRGTLDLLD